MLSDYLQAIAYLGIPVCLMTWWVYSTLFDGGHLDKTDSLKQSEKNVSDIRKSNKDL